MSKIIPIYVICALTIATISTGRADDKLRRNDSVLADEAIITFLNKHCVKCHGPDRHEGRLSLHVVSFDRESRESDIWPKVIEKLTFREMPPEGEPAPDEKTRERVTSWLRSQFVDPAVNDKYSLPAFGNLVSHEQLFGTAPSTVARSPPRLWRIRPRAYQKLVGEVSGHEADRFTKPFRLDTSSGQFGDYAAFHQLDPPSLQLLIGNATSVATRMTSAKMTDGKLSRDNWETPAELLTILDPTNLDPTDEEFAFAIDRQFHRVLLRDPTTEERQRLLKFTREGIQRIGRLRAIRNMISAVLLTPEALYRMEIGQSTPDEHGRVMLSPRELAFAIAYAFTDDRPDAEMMLAAKQGALASRDAVGKQVDRILNDPAIAKPRILEFFREYFGYGAGIDVFKDRQLFVSHDAEMLVRDTDYLVLFILNEDRDVLRELLTTNKSYVNYYVDFTGKTSKFTQRYGHLSYNLPHDWQWTRDQPITLPNRQRAGILTQPSWLVAHSDNFDNHAIRRGKWIREKLLGGKIPDLPITVDAKLPDDDSLTLRERMTVTNEPYCWNCHQQMNPLGLPLERYDHFGRWRAEELGSDVITSGAIDRSGEKSLNGEVQDPIEMIHKLADSTRVRQVFIRHAFRFWMGRNETPDDAATLQRADRDYVNSGGSMNALLHSLLTSDSFLYRDATEDHAIKITVEPR